MRRTYNQSERFQLPNELDARHLPCAYHRRRAIFCDGPPEPPRDRRRHSFDFADTHADAVAAAVARRPAIITSDVHLLAGEGPGAVAEIRSLLGHIPAIFITAMPRDCGAILEGDALLGKPIDRRELRRHFHRMQG